MKKGSEDWDEWVKPTKISESRSDMSYLRHLNNTMTIDALKV